VLISKQRRKFPGCPPVNQFPSVESVFFPRRSTSDALLDSTVFEISGSDMNSIGRFLTATSAILLANGLFAQSLSDEQVCELLPTAESKLDCYRALAQKLAAKASPAMPLEAPEDGPATSKEESPPDEDGEILVEDAVPVSLEKPDPESLPKGAWRVSVETNPLDDTLTYFASLEASSPARDAPSLSVRCKSGELDVYISWEDFLGTDSQRVTFRFGKQAAESSYWSISSDNTATFATNPKGFLRRLKYVESAVAQTTPYNDSPVTAVFNLEGIQAVALEAERYCVLDLGGIQESLKGGDYAEADGGPKDAFSPEDFPKGFTSGEMRLVKLGLLRGWGTAVKTGLSYDQTKTLYHQKRWPSLTHHLVGKAGDDLRYFLLGEAARATGFPEAARAYYEISLEMSKKPLVTKCSIGTCMGFNFPEETKRRLASLDAGEQR